MNESNSKDDSFHDNPKLSRHPSFLYKRKPIHFQLWLSTRKRRSLSVPDLHKLKKEWDLYQQVHSHLDNARSLQVIL
jgi:hypothetical protein